MQAYIIHCDGPMGFEVREAKKVPSLQKLGAMAKECGSICVCVCVSNFVKHYCKSRKEGMHIKHERIPKMPYDMGQFYGP